MRYFSTREKKKKIFLKQARRWKNMIQLIALCPRVKNGKNFFQENSSPIIFFLQSSSLQLKSVSVPKKNNSCENKFLSIWITLYKVKFNFLCRFFRKKKYKNRKKEQEKKSFSIKGTAKRAETKREKKLFFLFWN